MDGGAGGGRRAPSSRCPACPGGCFPRRRASSPPSPTARGATGSPTSTGRPRRRGRPGRTTPSGRPCTPPCGRGGTCRWSAAPPAPRGSCCTRPGRTTASGTPSSRQRWRARAAGWLTDYVAHAGPHGRAGRERADGRRDDRAAGALGPDRPDRPAGRRARHRRLQDRPGALHRRRGARVTGARRLRARGPAYAAPSVLRVELHHLPTGTVASFEHTDRSLANHVRRAEDITGDIARAGEALGAGADPDEAFPAVPGRQCGWCDSRAGCPTVRPPTPARETWSFLPEDDDPASLRRSGRLRGRPPGRTAPDDRRRRARSGSRSIACRNALRPAVAAVSVSPRPGREYSRRAHCGQQGDGQVASPPQAGWAGVR